MTSPRVFVTKQQPILIGHICSHCRNPVLSLSVITVDVQKSVRFSHTNAERVAAETALEAVKDEIRNISACKDDLTALTSEPKSTMLRPGLFCDVSVSGLCVACQNCGTVEPWQPGAGAHGDIKNLEADSFPIIFTDGKEASSWISGVLAQKSAAIASKRLTYHPTDADKKQTVSLFLSIQAMAQTRDAIPELLIRDRLKQKQEILLQAKNQLGLLDLSKKKLLKEKIKLVDLKLSDIEARIRNEEEKLNIKTAQLKLQLQDLQPLVYGITGKQIFLGDEKNKTFLLQINDIPVSDIEKYGGELSADPAYAPRQLFCRKCGFTLLPESAFCSHCGTKLI